MWIWVDSKRYEHQFGQKQIQTTLAHIYLLVTLQCLKTAYLSIHALQSFLYILATLLPSCEIQLKIFLPCKYFPVSPQGNYFLIWSPKAIPPLSHLILIIYSCVSSPHQTKNSRAQRTGVFVPPAPVSGALFHMYCRITGEKSLLNEQFPCFVPVLCAGHCETSLRHNISSSLSTTLCTKRTNL